MIYTCLFGLVKHTSKRTTIGHTSNLYYNETSPYCNGHYCETFNFHLKCQGKNLQVYTESPLASPASGWQISGTEFVPTTLETLTSPEINDTLKWWKKTCWLSFLNPREPSLIVPLWQTREHITSANFRKPTLRRSPFSSQWQEQAENKGVSTRIRRSFERFSSDGPPRKAFKL